MKMQLFETLRLKFEQANWARNPEFGLLDTILEQHPEIIQIAEQDVLSGSKRSEFGRQDMPSVEQIIRAAIYKEIKGLDYRDLEFAQIDSRICEQFVKLDNRHPFSFQLFQKYISKISEDSLQKLLFALNQIAIGEGLEDISKLRQDSTVIESNIHYPTNNSLVWDCIKEGQRLLEQLSEEVKGVDYRDYTKDAKKTYFRINNTRSGDKRVDLFNRQLLTFTKCINQVANIVKKKCSYKSIITLSIIEKLEKLLPVMEQVYSNTWRRELKGEVVPNAEKIFSIYEQHTDIIVKGQREVQFGHKVNLSGGKSSLILSCEVLKGNPSDKSLYQDTIDKVISEYQIIPGAIVTDGGYASKANAAYAKQSGIENIVFNKIVGSLKNIVSSKNMESRLKKWRSGMEAVISNLKRGYRISRCNWKGEAHFKQKVLWSVIAYNVRIMTAAIVSQLC